MDYAAFEERLVQTLINRSLLWGILALAILLLLATKVIYYCKTGDNSGWYLWKVFFTNAENRKLKYTTKQQIAMSAIALMGLSVVALMTVLPIWQDVSAQRYVKVEAEYKRTEISSESSFFSNGYVYAYADGQRIDLSLPAGWTKEEFPLGTYQGIIWYSEASKVILSFTAQ